MAGTAARSKDAPGLRQGTGANLLAMVEVVGRRITRDIQTRSRLLESSNSILQKQQSSLIGTTDKLSQECDKLRTQAEKGLKESKPYGDLINFQEVVERGILVQEECLKLIEERSDRVI